MELNNNLFFLPLNEIKLYGDDNLVYGSLTTNGINSLVKLISKYINSNIYGFDLGCGDGELIYHLGILLPGSVWEGVEISNHRINNQKRDVTIWQGDFLEENFRPYNILHIDNVCFSDYLNHKLEEKICNEFNGLIIIYKKITNENLLRKSLFLEHKMIEASWNNHTIYLYYVNNTY